VLQDYVDDFPLDAEGRRELAFDREVETAFYNTLPDNLDKLLSRHPLKCPVTFIGGDQSAEMKQVGMDMTRKVTKGRIMMLDAATSSRWKSHSPRLRRLRPHCGTWGTAPKPGLPLSFA